MSKHPSGRASRGSPPRSRSGLVVSPSGADRSARCRGGDPPCRALRPPMVLEVQVRRIAESFYMSPGWYPKGTSPEVP